MRVLMLINSFNLGGAEKLSYDLSRYLHKKPNCELFLYALGCINTDIEREIFQRLNSEGIYVGSFNKPIGKKRITTVLNIAKFCRDNRIDIMHTNGQSPDFFGRCSKILYQNVKIVVAIHNTNGYSPLVESLLNFKTDTYIAVSKDALNYAKTKLRICRKIVLIRNAIQVKQYMHAENKSNCFRILTVGRIDRQKNYLGAADYIAPFLNKHSDAIWEIFGDMSEHKDYLYQLKKKLVELGIEKVTVFKGVETNPGEIYKNGDIFLLASDWEGFGIVFIEAMASKLPVFANEVGILPELELLGARYFHLTNKNSFNELENIYNRMSTDREYLDKNYEIVKENFSIETMANQYLNTYRKVLNNDKTNNIYSDI